MQKNEETLIEREYDEWERSGEFYHLTAWFDGAWEVARYEAHLILTGGDLDSELTVFGPSDEAAMKEWARGQLEAEAEAYYEHQESEPRIRNWK